MALRVLIVDYHRIARDAIRAAIASCRRGPPEIVGEAADGFNALKLACQLRPDVITLDISLPGSNGLDIIRRLKEEAPWARVVVLTAYREREYEIAAMRAGAMSYIAKDRFMEDLPRCLDRLAAPERPPGADRRPVGLRVPRAGADDIDESAGR